MDFTNEQATLDVSFTTSIPSHPQNLSYPTGHAVPQMVITSADDTSEKKKNATECALVLIPPSNEHSIDVSDNRGTSAEFMDAANSVLEEKPVMDFEDISVVVRDVVSKCTESVSHSVRQRPLVMEVEKNTQQESVRDDSSVRCPPPLPPPIPSNVTYHPPSIIPAPSSVTPPPTSSPTISPPTAMQRPLVFEGVGTKTEISPELQKESTVNESYKNYDESVCDTPKQKIQPLTTLETETAKFTEECTTPTKKEGLHGVKKFFDSLLHHETQDTATDSKELVTQKESNIPTNIPEKGSVKKSKSELPPSPETPSENKESSFAKDAKQSIKAFFGTKKHESGEPVDSSESNVKLDLSPTTADVNKEKNLPSPTPGSPKEPKHSTSFAKDTKHNIKTFFDNLKHDPSEQKLKSVSDKKSVSPPDIAQEDSKNLQLSGPESPKESKESASFAKDTKQNIKAFFDTFKHESNEPKPKSSASKKSVPQIEIDQDEDAKNLPSSAPESPKSSFAKDTKQNIKAFFDTFKHESSEQKSKEGLIKISISQPIISQEMDSEKNLQSTSPESPKEPKESSSFVKDTKQNIKTFFDTFKHEPGEQKSKERPIKISISQPIISQEIDSEKNLQSIAPESPKEPKESSSFVKDTKHNIKTFFDTFKHEPSDQKQKDNIYKKSHSQPDFSKENIEEPLHESAKIPKDKESSSVAKGAKQNVKAFFDTFKPELSASKHEDIQKKSVDSQSPKEPNLILSPSENIKSNEVTKESGSFAKGAKQNIKTFFDSFKHESEDTKIKGVLTKKETVSEPDSHKELDVQHKDTKHPIKKLFSSKHGGDGGGTVSSQMPDDSTTKSSKEPAKHKPLKVTKSVTLDLNPQYSPNGAENVEKLSGSFTVINGHDKEVVCEIKERAQSVPSDGGKKKFGVFSEVKRTEVSTTDSSDIPDGKTGEHKGIKKFFDSFKHAKSDAEKDDSHVDDSKKVTNKDLIAMDLAVENKVSKAAEKPKKDKKNKSIRRSLSDKVSREEVVQNFKGFFDSIGHRSSKKSAGDSEHIYDVVEVKPDKGGPVPVVKIVGEEKESKKSSSKSESQGMKKILSPFRTKDVSKLDSESSYVVQSKNVTAEENANKDIESQKFTDLSKASTSGVKDIVIDDSSKEAELGSPKHEKSSMFDAIGENILALKERVLHTKEKRKSELIDDSTKLPELPSKTDKVSIEKDQKTAISAVCDQPSKKIIDKVKPVLPKKPTENKELPTVQATSSESKVEIVEEPVNGPGSLYDTCCIKLAVLLRDKALDIVAERTKSPPPKPPKPSAEAIARARAAAVSRRLEAQKMSHSIGENIPIGCDGIRFADDETESSCDYKDVENFDYIMDYELVNRYKLDSSKLDTFSVPSTCSGMTSYYTADTVTDIYSDAVMETISLSSDISYNMKQLSSACKSEPKISVATQKAKKGKVDVTSKQLSTAKSSGPKRVPPPIPPKPAVLQNISKIKGKSDDKAVSQCINGLSLSPRLQNKLSKDPAATQKRPLMVADIKGTQFSSLQHPKSRKIPPKPARNFETVLRNESIKNISCVTPANSQSPIGNLSPSEISTTENKNADSSLQSSIRVGKRTISPPRPPPPNVAKKPEKPPKPDRPPPPVKISKIISDAEVEEIPEKVESNKVETELTDANNVIDAPFQLTTVDKTVEGSHDLNLSETSVLPEESEMQKICNIEHAITENIIDDSCERNLSDEKDVISNNIDAEKAIADSLNNNIEVSSSSAEIPKPPPRYRRIRSRTVEIVPTERSEERLKRSQSLSEIDVQKRVTFLKAEKAPEDSKSLYTKINKDGKRSNSEKTSQSSPDLVSCRPLPAPPPPPRRFRSLERKGKSKKDSEDIKDEGNININRDVEPLAASSEEKIRAPARRRKTDKQRFFSLHNDHRKDIDESLKRAMSVPLKPSRKAKVSGVGQYDVNANISNTLSSEENLSNQNIPNIDSADSSSKNKSCTKSNNYSRQRSFSNWYDESDALNESWEVVDAVLPRDTTDQFKHNPLVPVRRKSDSKRKSRETSKFYVNMEEVPSEPPVDKGASPLPIVNESASSLPPVDKGSSPLPLVDKETSPLPLDCSEKSVQTSLETLSQGIVSHDDEQSEDTDELLDLAQTLQKELSTIINRHKTVTESTDETPSPPLSAATSERNLAEDFKEAKKISSVRSSISEVWPVTSSDESDIDRAGEDSSNINEVALRRKQKKIFYIAREIMTSEEAFVDALKLLNIDFKAAVDAAAKQKGICIIPDEVLSQILNHLPQLQHLNENLLMELKDRIENWDKLGKIADIIVKMGPFLKLYSWYIHDFESNVSLLEDSKKKYPAFGQIVKEFEMSTRCKRLALNHYMLKPIQRIPQYRLLLQEYLHHLTEDSKDYQDTVAALQIVSEVANHANDSMKQGDNAQKLISIQNSIMGHKEIVKPGRVFVKEGELMKLSRKGMQPRWFILFNDLLLYLTPVQQGLYRVNHELPLTGMKVAIPIQQDYQNEFSIISVTRSFTLAAKSQEERQEWIIALTKAIEENASKRKTFTNSRLHQKALDKTSSEEEGAFVLGRKAPVWIPDARVTMCQLCTSEFTVTFRRHHCRACGKVVCSICSSHRISLPYLGNRIARVCEECHIHLGQGSSACTESGETDSDNQQIAIKPHLRTDNRHIKKNKRMLPSVLKEVCANDQGSTISGYLHKKTGKSWKRDWFVVKDKVLYEYRASEDVAALRSIPLLGYQIESFDEAYEGIDASLLFQLTHPGQAPIVFYADTVGSTERWVSALKTATVLE